MPTYVFECPEGHVHEVSRPIDDRDAPMYCPLCNREGHKVLMKRKMGSFTVNWGGQFAGRAQKQKDGYW